MRAGSRTQDIFNGQLIDKKTGSSGHDSLPSPYILAILLTSSC
ncbi:hypothetical protein Pla22_28610 [Rubripirellula amarantea]|uniref:Uncharacterized protein n=1 Tax=Rubripirellula amarantea TaxID=2527999 RepID=A0A5C5WWX0_9BACT|nr:hypothetical protein Pla22_28610 [Rubripirellula amarantea]